MSYEDIRARLDKLIMESEDGSAVLGDSVEADIEALWAAVEPDDPANPTEAELNRLATAAITEAWLRLMRWHAGPMRNQGDLEFDRAVELMAPFAATPQLLPSRMAHLLSPDADWRMQLGIATDMVERAHAHRHPTTVNAAVALLTAAITAIERGDGPLLQTQANLANTYRLRYSILADVDDLERAIRLGEAVSAADSPDRADFLIDLSHAHYERFERFGERADIDRALAVASTAVGIAAGTGDSAQLANCLSMLAACHRTRYERYQDDPADIEQAVALGERAAALDDDSDILLNLAVVQHTRYNSTRSVDDLFRAVETARRGVAATAAEKGDLAGALSRLSSIHRDLFVATSDVTELDKAIETGEDALEAGFSSAVDEAFHVHHLGLAYRRRFQFGGVSTDLDRAVAAGEFACAHSEDDHPDLAMYLSALGASYRLRAEHGHAPEDVDSAIGAGEAALARTPDDHPQRPTRTTMLAGAYLLRFDLAGRDADLDRAIELARATADIAVGSYDRGAKLANLGLMYQRRYRLSRQPTDLTAALRLAHEADANVPRHDPARAAVLDNLALALRLQYEESPEDFDRTQPARLADEVLAVERSLPGDRMTACHDIGSLALAAGENEVAVRVLDAAVAMLPTIRPREGGWTDQARRLRGQTTLVADAVAAHCAAGDPAGAVEAAELGRGIILGAQLDARTDVSQLAAARPELAREFETVRDRLNDTGIDPGRARRHWTEYDEVLARIRQVPEFSRFLLSPPVPELTALAEDGAIVLLNACEQTGHAVIVTAGRAPEILPLPRLRIDGVQTHALWLHHVTTTRFVAAHEPMLPDVLEWLWEAVAEPVLAALAKLLGPMPRIRWLPIGLLGLFPLHAAGPRHGPGVLDLAVSSYTSTIKVLARARALPVAGERRQLLVAIPNTPGQRELPGAKVEAASLHEQNPDLAELTDGHATVANVLAALPTATWAHFACHAVADHVEPSRTALVLHDGPLPLTQVSELDLPGAELAYLSACSTADRGLPGVEESLHLASAFQMAGFRHVVASLWPLADGIAARAARSFYARMPPGTPADHAAAALHEVSRELRAAYPAKPHLWAALIHTG